MQAELTELALGMFVERGYDETTVDDIARAAGLSKRSFFRYFPSKEDVVFGGVDATAARVADAVRARPRDESPWESLCAALREWQGDIHAAEGELAGLALIESTPSLRARLHKKRDELRREVSDALRQRPGVSLDPFASDVLTAAAASALDAASREWLRVGGAADRGELLTEALALLSRGGGVLSGRPGSSRSSGD